MSVANNDQLPLVERIEGALLVLAYFIELDGDVHAPMYEKFEGELKELKARQNVKARAHQLLSTYTGWNASFLNSCYKGSDR